MSGIYDMLEDVLEVAEQEFCDPTSGDPREFSWMGESFACVASTLRVGSEVVPGGFEESSPITFTVRAALFAQAVSVDSTAVTVDDTDITVDSNLRVPRAGDMLEFEYAQYRVISVAKVPSHYRFVCESVDRI